MKRGYRAEGSQPLGQLYVWSPLFFQCGGPLHEIVSCLFAIGGKWKGQGENEKAISIQVLSCVYLQWGENENVIHDEKATSVQELSYVYLQWGDEQKVISIQKAPPPPPSQSILARRSYRLYFFIFDLPVIFLKLNEGKWIKGSSKFYSFYFLCVEWFQKISQNQPDGSHTIRGIYCSLINAIVTD